MSTPKTLLGKRVRKNNPVIVPIGAGLNDEREECFCLLIADGVAVALAYRTAGFTAKGKGALQLYGQQRVQERITAILKARASSPAVSLPEVTDMLKRVYAGSIHSGEYTPAHNAAFSLARLYGLVVDRAQVDVIRRPSREPDAPAELALGSWIEALPPYTPASQGPLEAVNMAAEPALSPAPIGPGPSTNQAPVGQGPGLLIEATTSGCDLDALPPGPGARSGTGNEAPCRPVTGTPSPRGRSAPMDHAPAWAHARWGTTRDSPGYTKTGPSDSDEGTSIPRAEDLF